MGNASGKEENIDFDGDLDLRHFNLLRCVGKGAFGKVRIVEKKDTKKQYALKYINKAQCLRMSAVQNIFRERAILIEVQHPFIVNLRFAFQDDENMFMVIDLMLGGDLRFQLDKYGGLEEDESRIIFAEIASGLNYLHSHNIVHRDLKPENILLDEYGHAHLTDFNIAVHFNDKRYLTSRSGTHSYMAPEVFSKGGYKWQVDFWSLGICVFETLFGKRPFRGQAAEDTSYAICNVALEIPSINLITKKPKQISPQCISFIFGLLERKVEYRLGCNPDGFSEFRSHPWFFSLDWEKLEKKEIQPIFVPEANKDNFDISHDLEELLLDDNPLRYRPRKKKASTTPSTSNPAPPGTPSSAVLLSQQSDMFKGVKNSSHQGSVRSVNGLNNSVNNLVGGSSTHEPDKIQDYDPYLQALQKGDHPLFKGQKVSARQRNQMEMEYIEEKFKDYDSDKIEREKQKLLFCQQNQLQLNMLLQSQQQMQQKNNNSSKHLSSISEVKTPGNQPNFFPSFGDPNKDVFFTQPKVDSQIPNIPVLYSSTANALSISTTELRLPDDQKENFYSQEKKKKFNVNTTSNSEIQKINSYTPAATSPIPTSPTKTTSPSFKTTFSQISFLNKKSNQRSVNPEKKMDENKQKSEYSRYKHSVDMPTSFSTSSLAPNHLQHQSVAQQQQQLHSQQANSMPVIPQRTHNIPNSNQQPIRTPSPPQTSVYQLPTPPQSSFLNPVTSPTTSITSLEKKGKGKKNFVDNSLNSSKLPKGLQTGHWN